MNKHFIMALKSNRTVALSEEEKQQGKFARIDSLSWSKPEPVKAWLKGLEFPVLLHRQVFKNR
ncbi:MAG: IS701 family transposase, partial [Cyanobacteria bacterium P01_C01_bin.72]